MRALRTIVLFVALHAAACTALTNDAPLDDADGGDAAADSGAPDASGASRDASELTDVEANDARPDH